MAVSFRRYVFSAACVGALAVSAVYPAWGSMQQIETYGGYVDMALESLGMPSTVIAGAEVTVPVRVRNLGPETADFPQVVFSTDSVFWLSGTSGCQASPQPSTRCQLEAPLAAGESRDVSFTGWLHPAARGVLTLGTFAMSEAIDINPGNEMILAAPTIAAYANLRVEVLNQQPTVEPDGRLTWVLEVSNAGVSDSLYPAISASIFPSGDVQATCTTLGANARCPEHPDGGWVGTDSRLRYTFSTPPLSEFNPEVYLSLFAYPQGEFELDWSDNSASAGISDAVFQDGMEF
jgi:hypothetical protein